MVEIIKEKREIDGIISEKIKNKKLIFTTHYRISSSEKGIDDEQVKEIFLQFERIYAIEKEILRYGDIGYELFYRLNDNTEFSIATCPKEDKLIIIHAVKYKRNINKRLNKNNYLFIISCSVIILYGILSI